MLTPCRPCCCPGTPCEHCLFGWQTEEYKHNLMKDNIRRYLSSDENFVGISSAKYYIEKHPNWEKEMEDDELIKELKNKTLYLKVNQAYEKAIKAIVYPKAEMEDEETMKKDNDAPIDTEESRPDYKTLFENLQDTCEDYRTKIRDLTAKLEAAEKELEKLRVLKKSLEVLTGREIDI